MQPQGRHSRERKGGSAGSGARTSQRQASSRDPSVRPSPGAEAPRPGHGPGHRLLLLLLIAGLGTLLVRTGPGLIERLVGPDIQAPPCSAAVNRWVSQRLQAARGKLQAEHSLYRAEGKQLNAIAAAMNWVDDRIIDQHIAEERRKLKASVLKSAGCVARVRD